MIFNSVSEFVKAFGGKRCISRILVSNNGLAAVKGIRSIRKWAVKYFGSAKMITFIGMATPEDLQANAEYVRLADELVEVPGKETANNYSNINLIVDTAERVRADAVWAGWGHASENPLLPEALSKVGITFIGPSGKSMRLLGDKISSSIVSETVGVPTIPWSGSGVKCDNQETFEISDETYQKACVSDESSALAISHRIGYPLMIKASAGGGGKGIRKATNDDELRLFYAQVKKEVPGSPIFLMKMGTNCRHLEVQIIGDEEGNIISLYSRDCSMQRRNQKIVEEGPISVVGRDVVGPMEQNAVALAKAVGYVNAGTVEYLYTEGRYYFLEINPRLYVFPIYIYILFFK